MSSSVAHLSKKVMAVVLAGGEGSRLKNLTGWRAKPAVPFGGKYRIIDFAPFKLCKFRYPQNISVNAI